MIKKSIVVMLLLSSMASVAQDKGKDTACKEFIKKTLVDKIKGYSSKNVIPYFSRSEWKWGYMDKVSKKKLTIPFMESVRFFTPNFYVNYSDLRGLSNDLDCAGLVKGTEENYDISKFTESGYSGSEFENYPMTGEYRSYEHMVNAGISGFQVDAKGRLIGFNPKYYNEKNKGNKFNRVFSLEGKYYALVDLRDDTGRHYSVINENGEAIKGFEDITTYIALNIRYSTDTDIWFSITNDKDDYDIKSLKTGEVIGVSKRSLDHTRNHMGYEIVSVGDKKGLLDVITMQWKIPPSDKNDFEEVYFSSSQAIEQEFWTYGVIPIEVINQNRERSDIYILNEKKTFYDLEMKEYKPKN